MMNYFWLLVFFCCTSLVDAQVYEVQYTSQLRSLTRLGTLYYNPQGQSYYKEVNTQANANKGQEEGETKVFYLGARKSKPWYQIYPKTTDSLVSIQHLNGDLVRVQEYFKPMKWKITSETKTIEQWKLQKAVTFFRGRQYIAWFLPQFSINLGPWKFNNLPGLIVQVYNKNKTFTWSVSKIKQLDHIVTLPDFSGLKTMTLQAYVEASQLENTEKIDRAIFRALGKDAKNAQIIESKTSIKRGRERQFSWEKEL